MSAFKQISRNWAKTVPMKKLCLAFTLTLAVLDGAAAAEPEPVEVSSVARRLDAERPALRDVDRLRSRGLLELSAGDWRFGGLSGLDISADGARLTAVTDQGNWFTARLLYDEHGDLSGLTETALAPLRDPDGDRLTSKFSQDAESLAPLPEGGLLVAFEHQHRLWGYGANGLPAFGAATPFPIPGSVARLPRNDGIETVATLPDGRLLIIASHADGAPAYPAHLWQDGRWHSLAYSRDRELSPTGATTLPNGDLLVSERHYSVLAGVTVQLRRVPLATIRPGATLSGELLARFRPPLLIDNMEGIAARRGPGGESLIYLLSDDNFNPLQRTLLMMFALEDDG